MFDMRKRASRRDAMDAQKGFTLIELSIVLVIIGLLVGGVIKGQELIKGARISNLNNAVQGYIAAANNYMGTYRSLPGDDNRVDGTDARWDSITGISNGDGDGVIDGGFNAGAATAETRQFFQHLRAAGLIPGANTDSTLPVNAFGGVFSPANNGNGFTGAVLCTNGVPGDVATRVDLKDDDGTPNGGDIRAAQGTGPGTAATSYTEDQVYTLCWRL